MIINTLCRSFFGYERLSSFRGVREFRYAPVDQKRTKKIKAPIPHFKNLYKRQVRWASYERLSSSRGVRELVTLFLGSSRRYVTNGLFILLFEFVGSSLRSSAPNSLRQRLLF